MTGYIHIFIMLGKNDKQGQKLSKNAIKMLDKMLKRNGWQNVSLLLPYQSCPL